MSVTKGSCNCGDYKWEATGDPAVNAVCHCIPCRKTAGSNGSVNLIFPSDNYKVISGTPAKWTRKGDSGKQLTYSFCSTCHTFMSVDAESGPGTIIVKTGTIDEPADGLLSAKPAVEIYTSRRPVCFSSLEGLAQFEGAPPS